MSSNKQQKTGRISYIFTKETMGLTLILFSGIVFLILLTRSGVFAGLGEEICNFMYGSFGYGAILLSLYTAYLGIRIAFGKKFNISKKYFFAITATLAILFFLFHAVTTRNIPIDSYGGYLKGCYESAKEGWKGYTTGGAVCGLIVYPVARVTTFIGAYVIFSLLFLLCAFSVFMLAHRNAVPRSKKAKEPENIQAESENREQSVQSGYAPYAGNEVAPPAGTSRTVTENGNRNYEQSGQKAETAQSEANDRFSRKNLGRKILFENGEFDAESYKRNMIFNKDSYFNHPEDGVKSYLSNFKTNQNPPSGQPQEIAAAESYVESYQNEVANRNAPEAPSNYVYGEKPVENLGEYGRSETAAPYAGNFATPSDAEPVRFEEPRAERIEEVRTASEERTERYAEPEIQPRPVQNIDLPRDMNAAPSGEDSEEVRADPEKEAVPTAGNRVEGMRTEQEKPRSILSSLFGSEARRDSDGERRREITDSKINLFDDDNNGEDDVFGTVNRGSMPSREDTPELGRGLRGRTEEPPITVRGRDTSFGISDRKAGFSEPKPEPPKAEKPKHVWKKYIRPSLDLLDDYPENNNVNSGEIEDNKRIIVETLEKFKIESEVANVTVGPAITRYDVIIADRTNIKRSLSYRDEIAIALMKSNVNAYLNYEKGALSIEIPNNKRAIVGLKTMLASPQFINCKPNSLTFGLGKSVDGEVVCPNITKMPHLLVAGTTGSGKSICLNTLLVSLLYKYGPEELRLILVDPKQAEFIPFARLPHLMINEILYDVDKVIKALNWAIKEMERRYTLFKEMTENGNATKNLDEYNAHLPEGEEKLPKILIVLDEFSDLMMQAKKEIEFKIIRLAQKARACGIHLILATQRPSVDCITGLIKSNLPSRIGFKVNSFEDSRIIFDIGGAEKLLGMGDMFFRSVEKPNLERIQGCFIDSHEVQKVTDFIRANNETYFDEEASDFINKVEEPEMPQSLSGDGGEDSGDGKMDDTYLKALKYCVASNQASVSMIQRRFPVGYIKACKIIDWMEKMNYITQSEGSKPRKVLMTMDEFTNTYGEVDD